MTERFIVKGTRIKDTDCDEYLTLREVCEVLNNQDKVIIWFIKMCKELNDEEV